MVRRLTAVGGGVLAVAMSGLVWTGAAVAAADSDTDTDAGGTVAPAQTHHVPAPREAKHQGKQRKSTKAARAGDATTSADADNAPKPAVGAPSASEAEAPDVAVPVVTKPDTAEPESPGAEEPDVAVPVVTKPDTSEPESPGAEEPDVTQPSVTKPDTSEPDIPTAEGDAIDTTDPSGHPLPTTNTAVPKPAVPERHAPDPALEQQAEESTPDTGDSETSLATTTPTQNTPTATAPTSTQGATERAAVTLAAAATTTSTRAPSLVNVIGSLVVNLLMGLIHLVDGPPALPANSTVTVRTSSLVLPIGAGRKVQADWYFPENADQSTRLIYLQHGFLASGPMYSYTAANLAERTNSIVVVPSLSSNFFSANAEWVGGSTMQRAVADLFLGDRAALTESATAAAGYPITVPQKFALVGHSAGGTLVTAVAGYLAADDADGDLVGVVMLDGVEPKGSHAVGDALAELTGDHAVPIYLISSQRYMWNRDGDMADKLMAARPNTFNGVALAGGTHIDYMEGGNVVIQLGEYLVSGFSKRENIDAAGILTAGWINDLFDGTTTNGTYGQPSQQIPIATAGGTATAGVLPVGPAGPSPLGPILDPLLAGLLEFAGQYLFVYDPLRGAVAV